MWGGAGGAPTAPGCSSWDMGGGGLWGAPFLPPPAPDPPLSRLGTASSQAGALSPALRVNSQQVMCSHKVAFPAGPWGPHTIVSFTKPRCGAGGRAGASPGGGGTGGSSSRGGFPSLLQHGDPKQLGARAVLGEEGAQRGQRVPGIRDPPRPVWPQLGREAQIFAGWEISAFSSALRSAARVIACQIPLV